MFDGQFDRNEHHQTDDADSLADMNIVGLPTFLLPVGQGGQAGDEGHGEERKAEHIEGPFGPVRAKRPHDDHAGQQGDHPEGQVDGKDRSPAEGIGQIAAQGWAQRGSGHDAGAPDAQRPPAFVRFKQFRHDGHADRLDGAAPQGLKDAGGDQRFIAPRHGTEGAGRREDQQTSQVKGLVADPAGEPADQRHDDRRGQHESRRDPLDLLTVDPEGAHHVRQGDVDDAGVQNRHERAHHDDAQHAPPVGPQRAVAIHEWSLRMAWPPSMNRNGFSPRRTDRAPARGREGPTPKCAAARAGSL